MEQLHAHTVSGAGYRQEVTIRTHHLVADEPADVGGADAGPIPKELLLAALGTCTAMTLQLYAAKKGWPLTGVTVDCDHAEPTGTVPRDTPTRITRRIALAGALDADQRARLLDIAGRCPVHRILTGTVEITDAPADAPPAQ